MRNNGGKHKPVPHRHPKHTVRKMNARLVHWIKDAKAKGYNEGDISSILSEHGYGRGEIQRALR